MDAAINSKKGNFFPEEEILNVLLDYRKGNFSTRMPVHHTGVYGKICDVLNDIIEMNNELESQIKQAADTIGKKGILTHRLTPSRGSGSWEQNTSYLNALISDLVHPTSEIANVISSVAKGDLSKYMPLEIANHKLKGEFYNIAKEVNDMVRQLTLFSQEVTRVAREVGSEGKLGGQAKVKGVAGVWKDLTDSVNLMASNLTDQVRNIADVTTSVANGDLSKKITVDVKGEILGLKNTINTMVDQLNSFASEVTRVAQEVGTEGKLGGQAQVKGIGGTWKDLTDSVNLMASNLTAQVRNIAEVTTAVAKGDLSKKITVNVEGEILELKDTINIMVDQLNSFASEVTRVAVEVGTKGILGGQAEVKGVAGTWKDLTGAVNQMASNLTGQVRNIAEVTTAVAKGDLSKKITVNVEGEILQLKNTINTMVDQLNSFASEVTRVAVEVGSEGKLGGQAKVKDVGGVWKDLTDSVNLMAGNLTAQVRNIADVTTAVANGNLSKKITVDVKGEILELKNTINTMVDQLNSFASEVTKVAVEVGSEGKLGGQAKVKGVGGVWKDLTDSVNKMGSNLTAQVRNIAEVTTAVANGDLSKKITVIVEGEILELKNTINTMVDQLNSFASEVTRVALEVGTEGKLGGTAKVKGVAGVWKDLTNSVNQMGSNLTAQVRNIAEVTTAVANGDLSKKITVNVEGEILELKNTINTMVDQLNSFASEVTRVALEVGTEGKLGGQAKVKGAAGVWKDLTDSVNQMASNLTAQVRNIAEVTTAVANGDLSKKITVSVEGEILQLKNTINTMVDQLKSFSSEVTRVALEVGSEGKLGGQAKVKEVGGVWKDLTDSVNLMAGNLTAQVRNIADVTTAVANGDLSRKITVSVEGEILELKNTINTMVDQLNSFASEVTRVAVEVGSEGKLGGQAKVKDVGGVWKDLTDSVNLMAGNLTSQVRNIAEVTTSVAKGDLSKKITVDVKGEILELKNTINTMVDQLRAFASEVTRVALEVGTEGKLGGQASVEGVGGVWKDLTKSVNLMAGNLTAQVRNIADVTTSVANGDLSKKITVDVRGEILELKNTINTMVDQLNSFASEVTRVALEVGSEGKLGGQAQVRGVGGTWKDLTDSVNFMASNLTAQVRNIADVTTSVAKGDLSKKITVDVKGEILELKNTINTMVDQLNSFASEVTRVALEVGSEGKLGGQAQVKEVAGTWKDLTNSVNFMASNLTSQVRGIAKVVTSVAKGNLKQKLLIPASGEIAQLSDTINEMIDTLATFADQVTNVAKEVGVEGRLGGQASVPGASGLWKDLTENVNQLAANLTTQVRAISEVANAVTKGDLTRTIRVEAKGEVESLKDTINQMIANLKETTIRTQDQDWLKSNLAKFTQMLQGKRDLYSVANKILSELAQLIKSPACSFYLLERNEKTQKNYLKLYASFALQKDGDIQREIDLGVGLVGQCALIKERILLSDIPPGYLKINSSLGETGPITIMVLPVMFEGQVKAVIELASLFNFNHTQIDLLDQLTETIGIVINTIEANTKTEQLLVQSQSLAEALSRTNEELQEKAILLEKQKEEVETKNRAIEEARSSLEEKAEQLTVTSKYKSEFLANMSHELRTPLNSLLILSQQLIENPERNLTEKQVGFARTIYSCGDDLTNLINDILDLSKIESGFISIHPSRVFLKNVRSYVETTFRPLAESKNLRFSIELQPGLPEQIETDSQRLNQILKNLLSNAFKFTEKGEVTLKIYGTDWGVKSRKTPAEESEKLIVFSITDTGIGIPKEKQSIIFEAFQQVEGSSSRKYGGTGLGLSISRGLAELLGGSITVESEEDKGSTFSLYLPLITSPEAFQKVTRAQRKPIPWEQVKTKSIKAFSEAMSMEEDVARQVALESIPAEESFTPIFEDDRLSIMETDRKIILIIEDDQIFSNVILEKAREKGWKGLQAKSYSEVFELINKFKISAISLDIYLPGGSGLKLLKLFKNDVYLQHVPVYIIAENDKDRDAVMKARGRMFLTRPVKDEDLTGLFNEIDTFEEKKVRELLVVEDNQIDLARILNLFSGLKMVHVTTCSSGKEAEEVFRNGSYDAVIIDSDLSDYAETEAMVRTAEEYRLYPVPVITLVSGDQLSDQLGMLKAYTRAFVKKDSNLVENLLRETIFQLHIPYQNLEAELQDIFRKGEMRVNILEGKNILIVDDDVRNLFALTAAFEKDNIKVITSESGMDALKIMYNKPMDMVLMDIMMPDMDGYETMRRIRAEEKFKNIPIIAVTAKAMKGDREKCLEAGASDYISKPIIINQLLSLMKFWIQN
jgi:HAMP domain-containing protein/signal transduction histidine kinase/DNA-binding response OmpR family regulator